MNHPTARAGLAGLILASMFAAVTPAGEEEPQAWLGVYLDRPPSEETADGGTTPVAGARIVGIIKGGPADRAGLRAQDRIVAVESGPVGSPRDLISALATMEPGRWVSLTVDRSGEELDIEARLAPRPQDARRLRVRTGWIGVEAIDLPESLRLHFGARDDAGVMISGVEPGSPAEVSGLRLGDLLYEIGGGPVRSTDDLRRRVATGGVGNTLEISVVRNAIEKITVEALVATAPEPDEP